MLIGDVAELQALSIRANSIAKSSLHDPDRFGYLSVHYVAKLKHARVALDEYASGKQPARDLLNDVLHFRMGGWNSGPHSSV
jgi:hypothetical protein